MKAKALLVMVVFLLWAPPLLRAESVLPKETANEVVALGTYSNMRFTKEHQYGYEVALWHYRGGIIGHFLHAEGLAGDTPMGLIQSASYDEKTGEFSFVAKLTMGSHVCAGHQGVPSREMFEFKGTLRQGTLTGTVVEKDSLHGLAVTSAEEIVLKTDARSTPLASFRTFRDWENFSDEIINFRGPKW